MDTKKLRQKILDLAIRGKLVPQNPNDEPASVLIEKIRAEKEQLIKEKKIKRDKNESHIYRSDKSYYEKFANGTVKCIDEEIPFEIPESWEWCRGYSCFLPMVSTKPTNEFFRYIDIESVDNKKHSITSPKVTHSNKAPSRASRKLSSGDTLFSMVRPYLENIAFIDNSYADCIASTGFYVCKPNEFLFPEYSFRLMTSLYVIEGLNQYMKGDNSPSINNDNILSWLYPIPPFAEQQKIVSTIEQYNDLVNDLEQNKDDLQQFITQTKSKILDLAIRGKLVPQDSNDEPASVLLERIKAEQPVSKKKTKKTGDNSHYENLPFEIPENWAWTRFQDVFNIVMGQSPSGEFISSNGGYEFHQGKTYFGDRSLLPSQIFTSHVTKLAQPYSLLMCVRAPVGDINITEREICIGRGLCALKPLNEISLDFMYYWTSYSKNSFVKKATGTTFLAISGETIRNEYIPLPPLDEQRKITKMINSLYGMLDDIIAEL